MRTALLLVLSLLLPAPGPPAPADAPWRWPLEGTPLVLRAFDPPEQRWERGHLGVDLAAEPGQRVYAAGGGRVHFAGPVAGTGVVSVVHGDLRTTYLPVDPAVAPGDRVEAGDLVGTLASAPPHCPRPCLHWGLLRGRDHLDPLSLLGRGQVRLLTPGDGPARRSR